MNARVIIGDNELELAPGTVVAVTRQVFDLASWQTVQVDHTNTFTIPRSLANLSALGLPDSLQSEGQEYTVQQGRVFQDGAELINDGTAVIDSVTPEGINITIYGGGFDFWEAIETATIHDITTLKNYDHAWTQAVALGVVAATSGHIYPVIQYGSMTTSSDNLDIRYSFPAFYIHTLITDLISIANYTKSGSFLTNQLYLDTVLPWSKNEWKHAQRIIDKQSWSYSIGSSQYVSGVGYATGTEKEKTLTLDPQSIYTAQAAQTRDVDIKINVSGRTVNTTDGGSAVLRVVIYKNNTTEVATTTITGNGDFSVSTTGLSLSVNDTVEAAIIVDYTIVADPVDFSFTVIYASFYSDEATEDIVFGDTVGPESYLPDYNQADFLKEIFKMFGVIPIINTKNQTIKLTQLSEVYDNLPNALDWSDKLMTVDGLPYLKKETQIGNYGQSTYLNYSPDEFVKDNYGRGVLTVADSTLPIEADFFTLKFAASESVNVTTSVQKVARIHAYESDGAGGYTLEHRPKQRILYISRTGTADYTDGTTTNTVSGTAPIGKFIDPAILGNLGFNNSLKAVGYSDLQTVLTNPVKLTVLLDLDAVTVQELDHLVPVYFSQFRNYFYVNKVVEFVAGEFTEVELIKL